MTDKAYLVRFKPRELGLRAMIAASAEIHGEHIALLNSRGKLVALFLMEIVEKLERFRTTRLIPQDQLQQLDGNCRAALNASGAVHPLVLAALRSRGARRLLAAHFIEYPATLRALVACRGEFVTADTARWV
jgi:hypothetical protein